VQPNDDVDDWLQNYVKMSISANKCEHLFTKKKNGYQSLS